MARNRVKASGNGDPVGLDVALASEKQGKQHFYIPAPNQKVVSVVIEGTASYSQHRFSEKARKQIRAKQEAGSQGQKGIREAKDFEECCRAATYRTADGHYGIPAGAFRNAMVSACRMVGFQMTRAKLAIEIKADGNDVAEGMPLVYFTDGTPEPVMWIAPAPNSNGGIDLRSRPRWAPGWRAVLRVEFDADQFTAQSVVNLIARAGKHVGVGEGRNDSKKSCGIGFGGFCILDEGEAAKEVKPAEQKPTTGVA